MGLCVAGSAKPSAAAVAALLTALVLLHGQGSHGGSNSILQTMPSGLASLHNSVATFVKQGVALGNRSTRFEAKMTNICHCRALCWSNLTCTAFSFSSVDGCCNIGQDYADFVTFPSSTMVFRVKNPEMGKKKNDGLYYFFIDELVPIATVRSRCEQMPGFRLAIARTNLTLDVIKKFAYAMLDLTKKTPQSELMWGDQTAVDPTIFLPGEPKTSDGGRYFNIYLGSVDDMPLTKLFGRPLCQGNFDKIDW